MFLCGVVVIWCSWNLIKLLWFIIYIYIWYTYTGMIYTELFLERFQNWLRSHLTYSEPSKHIVHIYNYLYTLIRINPVNTNLRWAVRPAEPKQWAAERPHKIRYANKQTILLFHKRTPTKNWLQQNTSKSPNTFIGVVMGIFNWLLIKLAR